MVPADAVNCDCTSLAWATLRPNSAAARRRRQLRQRTKQDDDCYKKPTKEISSPDSVDSGVASTMGDIGIPPSGKSWKRRRRRTLGVFLGNMMRKMFDIPRDKSPSRIELPRISKAEGGFSPKWRIEDANEVSPIAKFNQLGGISSLEPPVTPSASIETKTEVKRSPSALTSATVRRAPPPIERKIDFDESDLSPRSEVSTARSFSSVASTPSARATPRKPSGVTSIAGKLANMPRFHFPDGRPISQQENDAVKENVHQLFHSRPGAQLQYSDMADLCRRMRIAVYSKRAVYDACYRLSGARAVENGSLTFDQFATYWQKMTDECHDEASRFIFTLATARTGETGRKYVTKEDFTPMLMDLIHTHPGLKFLADAVQFHGKYCEVVTVRILWNVNRSWSGRITAEELRRSNFLDVLRSLDGITDINKVTEYFSYEHFYVTYCKFWELDQDHDMVISREDMRHHCNGALTDQIIDRIFSAAVTRTAPDQRTVRLPGPVRQQPIETIGFEEFVAFLLAEEDKKHPTSIEYWFRCLDMDGDGFISLFEMEHFYRGVENKLSSRNMETLSLSDVVCNLLDLVTPKNPPSVSLNDLKRCGLAHRFFNTFVNYIKYVEQESSDGERASLKTNGDKEMSDWEQFCMVEYEILMGENDDDGFADENIDVNLDDEDANLDNIEISTANLLDLSA
ncbi:EF hand family protein [Aphelenchoides avenae]|nr:EF hand family protein [Aphelenchus avenae]